MNSKVLERILKFRDERDWKQFHNFKDSALSLVLEANEVLEHSQWKNGQILDQYVDAHKKEIGDELADVLFWLLLISHDLDIDLEKAILEKMEQNEKKYPIEKAKGRAVKYTQL